MLIMKVSCSRLHTLTSLSLLLSGREVQRGKGGAREANFGSF